AHPGSALAVLLELPGRGEHFSDIGKLRGLELSHRLSRILAVKFLEHRLVVEGIDLGRSAVHVEENDVLGALAVMGHGMMDGGGAWRMAHQRGEGDGTKSRRASREH